MFVEYEHGNSCSYSTNMVIVFHIHIRRIFVNMNVVQFNATCFSLFPDARMADLLGALDSRNGGEQKCISR
jgi:hypothetical protein